MLQDTILTNGSSRARNAVVATCMSAGMKPFAMDSSSRALSRSVGSSLIQHDSMRVDNMDRAALCTSA